MYVFDLRVETEKTGVIYAIHQMVSYIHLVKVDNDSFEDLVTYRKLAGKLSTLLIRSDIVTAVNVLVCS